MTNSRKEIPLSVEDTVKEVLNEVLDVKPEEIEGDAKLDVAFGVDSTEMVEINVAIKKKLGLEEMQNNTLSKTNSFNEMIEILKSKGA